MKIDVSVQSNITTTTRVKQLEGLFDCPISEKQERSWTIDAPLEDKPWNVGLIVGPSGAGKSTVMRALFNESPSPLWSPERAVIDDFSASMPLHQIAEICAAVGFNTIPAWMRPYATLSNGEQFRVNLARVLASDEPVHVVDEFTSVVDRQVAKIGSHAVQKFVRRNDKKFVAVTCHYDVEEWLNPDWIIEPHEGSFRWRSLRPRTEKLSCEIREVDRESWRTFAPFHYMSASLRKDAQCFVLFVNEQPASFAAIIIKSISNAKIGNNRKYLNITRLVTLPDFQGLGLAMMLVDKIGEHLKKTGLNLIANPAHYSLVRVFDKSKNWQLKSMPQYQPNRSKSHPGFSQMRPCVSFLYVGK